jgi:hypothetical protein
MSTAACSGAAARIGAPVKLGGGEYHEQYMVA